MGNDAVNTVGQKIFKLDEDSFQIQHQCVLAEMNSLRIDENILVVYPNRFAPVIYPARLLDVSQQGDLLYLKVWNYYTISMQMYLQDLSADEFLFFFVSIPFINQLIEMMANINHLEFRLNL